MMTETITPPPTVELLSREIRRRSAGLMAFFRIEIAN